MLKKLVSNLKTDKFVQGTIFLTGVNIFGAFFNYLVHPLAARRLTVAEYGDFQVLLSFSVLIGVLYVILLTATTKEVSNLKKSDQLDKVNVFYKRLAKNVFILGFLIFVVMAIVASPLKTFFKISSLSSIIIASIFFIYNLVNAVQQGILSGVQEFAKLAINTFLLPLVRFILILVLVYLLGFQLVGASVALGLTGVLALIYGFIQIRKLNFPASSQTTYNFKFLYKYSFLVLLFIVANQLFFNVDMLFAKAVLHEDVAGLYASLLTVGRIIFFVGASIPLVLFPVVAEQMGSKNLRQYKVLMKSLMLTAILVVPVMIFMYFLPEFTLRILVGEKFVPVAVYLPLFTWPMLFLTVINVLLKYFLALEQKLVGIILVAGVLVEFAILYFSGRDIRSIIMAITYAFGLITIALLTWLYICYKKDKQAFKLAK